LKAKKQDLHSSTSSGEVEDRAFLHFFFTTVPSYFMAIGQLRPILRHGKKKVPWLVLCPNRINFWEFVVPRPKSSHDLIAREEEEEKTWNIYLKYQPQNLLERYTLRGGLAL
jgi:hypothetical protein